MKWFYLCILFFQNILGLRSDRTRPSVITSKFWSSRETRYWSELGKKPLANSTCCLFTHWYYQRTSGLIRSLSAVVTLLCSQQESVDDRHQAELSDRQVFTRGLVGSGAAAPLCSFENATVHRRYLSFGAVRNFSHRWRANRAKLPISH